MLSALNCCSTCSVITATTISASSISRNMQCLLSAVGMIACLSSYCKCFKMMSTNSDSNWFHCSSFISACYSLQLCPVKCTASVQLAFVVWSSAVDYYFH